MKRIARLVCLLLFGFSFSGCGGDGAQTQVAKEPGAVKEPGLQEAQIAKELEQIKGLNTVESQVEKKIELYKEFNNELAAIKSAEDLKKAEDQLEKRIQLIKALNDKKNESATGDISEQKAMELMQKYSSGLMGVRSGFKSQISRLSEVAAKDPEAARVLSEVKSGGSW